VLRWFLDGTRLTQLAADNRIGRSTAYRYLHEGLDVLSAAAPGLRGGLLAARAAGHAHVTVDGTLVRTDRCRVAGPTARADRPERRVDRWWSGKHACHGGNVQVIAAPDGWPIWTSPVRPGREHDTTALRTHPEALPLLAEWTDDEHAALADLGYEGERAALTIPIKQTTDAPLTDDQRTVNLLHAATRAPLSAATPCSRPPSRRCAGSASAPGASPRSPPPPLSSSITSTAGRHDHRPPQPLPGIAHCHEAA
jgi:DDE superfamily endonuclease